MARLHRSTSETGQHIPVMLHEALHALAPVDGGIYVDGTFGAGGYTRGILNAAHCTVYGIDRDPEAAARAEKLAKEFKGRFFFLQGCFGNVTDLLKTAGVEKINGFILDLGVSSMQIDDAGRGFSFRAEGPLDMRMAKEGQSARDVVNTASEKDLADIIFNYGEEHAARKIARRIVAARSEKPIETTKDLAHIVHDVLPMHGGIKTDTATKTFQALRIYVNDELGELERALAAAERILLPGGRLVVVSFHSLEDSRVKNFLREKSGKQASVSRHLPYQNEGLPVLFKLEKTGSIKPSDDETRRNPRARSAKLRYAIRTATSSTEAAHA